MKKLELPDDIASLKQLIIQLFEENERLKAEIDRLRAENAELRRRLGMDSHNSHKPPSSDGFKKKTITPGLPKEKNPRGGQPGHTGDTLKRVISPDHIQVHLPQQCTCCGRALSAADSHEIIQSRQVFDLPQPRLEVTEHRVAQVVCCCGAKQAGVFPPDVTASVQYGAGVRAFVTKLSIDHRMPLKQISQLFGDMYGYDLNTTTIEEILQRAYTLTEPIEAEILAQLRTAELAHFDETGLRVMKTRYWLYVASTACLTYLFVLKGRSFAALNNEAAVLRYFSGIAVHDCLPAYFRFPQARHVLCLAHLIRELRALAEEGSQWAKKMYDLLMRLYKMLRPLSPDHAEQVLLSYRLILEEAEAEEPLPQSGQRGRPKQSKGRNLLDRLRKHETGVLAFAFELDVPFTNNQAERDLRPAKVKQKISGCFRTLEGAEVYARLQAVISTFRKQGMNVFASLHKVFSCTPVNLVRG